MAGRLAGKIALVTGGSTGIGRATALVFAREGATVAVADIDEPEGMQTVDAIKRTGSDALFIKADVSKAPEVEAMVARVVEVYGRLDCAFNNAGIEGGLGTVVECTEENWDRIMGINLKGVWLCMKYEIPQMIKQGGGAIVNTASIAGLFGSTFGIPAYIASKHGVVGLTKAAALENARNNIRVNAVCPGRIRTSMHDRLIKGDARFDEQLSASYPTGRLGKPEEVAEAVVWLCSDAASFVSGHPLVVDSGYTVQ